MELVMKILTGGFLKGYRTVILGAALIVDAVAKYLVGDMGGQELFNVLPELIAGLGLWTAKAAAVDAKNQ